MQDQLGYDAAVSHHHRSEERQRAPEFVHIADLDAACPKMAVEETRYDAANQNGNLLERIRVIRVFHIPDGDLGRLQAH